jgi:A/G-specific adenine glycosylase
MLQQTQAARVVPHYERWIEAFPDPMALVSAGPAAAVIAWAGLGYNRRALALHRTAVIVTEDHDGRVPDDLAALVALPGVGPYTARAVLAFAYERDVGVVDTNVARVLRRAVAGRALGPAAVQALADSLVPAGRSWAYNQTLFDIGATTCRAREPACADCPLVDRCAWAASGSFGADPAGVVRRQGRFEGSNRQGRGRMLEALRRAPVEPDDLAASAGWTSQPERARRVADDLVADGLAEWAASGALLLPGP